MVRHLVALLAVVVPCLTLAEPAVIRVFETSARAEPRREAPALETFLEGARVTVSEEATGGWRRIRLATGGVGWVEEADLTLGPVAAAVIAPAPAAPAPGPAQPAAAATPPSPAGLAPQAAAPAPDLHARIYVKDLDHLAELMKGDPQTGPAAHKLVVRRYTAWSVIGAGFLVGGGLLGYSVANAHGSTDPASPSFGKSNGRDGYFIAGVATAITATAVGLFIMPKVGDLLDVVNDWNTRHPDQPFSLEHGMAAR